MPLKYKTKKDRLVAIVDAYGERCDDQGKSIEYINGITMREAAEWAMFKGLWPVPTRNDSEEVCEAWERKLAESSY